MQVNIWMSSGSFLEWGLQSRSRRDSPEWVARRDLERYYVLMDAEFHRIDDGIPVVFSDAEWNLIREVLAGILGEKTKRPKRGRYTWEYTWQHLPQDVDDAIRFQILDEKWNVEGRQLVRKLHLLCPGQLAAMVDSLERWWLKHAEA